MFEYMVQAEMANKRRQFQRNFHTGRELGGPTLLQRIRHSRHSRQTRRNPVRGALRYESDGPLTRRIEDYWISAATHH
jgi:hypothetical protein